MPGAGAPYDAWYQLRTHIAPPCRKGRDGLPATLAGANDGLSVAWPHRCSFGHDFGGVRQHLGAVLTRRPARLRPVLGDAADFWRSSATAATAGLAAASAAGGSAAPAAASCPMMAGSAGLRREIDLGEAVRDVGAAGAATMNLQHSCCPGTRRNCVRAESASRAPEAPSVQPLLAAHARMSGSTRARAAPFVEYLLLLLIVLS